PGLKAVAPATPYDAKGLFLNALRDGNPVIFFEHKKLYRLKGPVPEEDYEIPIGRAVIKREGDDITIATYSYMLHEVLKAAEVLEREHRVSAEVLDLRSIHPVDRGLIGASVRKTGRLLVVDEGWAPCGVSAEVISVAVEEALEYMDARPARLNTLHTPIPFSPPLEKHVLPDFEKIVYAALKVVKEGW
ncbi:MAG: alpha-ketoacid dehydrogenase subunit beta, partial [Thermoprotei archaeon]